MAAKQQHFSPKQIAKALAVSESSVKRWCDQQRIATFHTEGGHRRISLEDVYQFLRHSDRRLTHPEVLGLPPLGSDRKMHIPGADQPLKQEFRDALVAGCEETCRQILRKRRAEGEKAWVISEHLMTDAMHAVGDAWQRNEINPYQERRACEICLRAVRELLDGLPPAATDSPVALGGTPGGDPYQLPTAMVELTLRELGWNASSLGNNLPMDCLFQAVHDYRPNLVWVSVSHIEQPDDFIAAHNRFAESLSDDVIMLVGGRALTDTIRPKLKYTAYCDSLSHLSELVNALAP